MPPSGRPRRARTHDNFRDLEEISRRPHAQLANAHAGTRGTRGRERAVPLEGSRRHSARGRVRGRTAAVHRTTGEHSDITCRILRTVCILRAVRMPWLLVRDTRATGAAAFTGGCGVRERGACHALDCS